MTLSFEALKQIVFYLLLIVSVQQAFSQERQVQGIVFDANSKQRISRVYIYNTRTHQGFYNNTKGEFNTKANIGDVLLAAVPGYHADTLKIKSSTVIFYLKRNAYLLNEVVIRDSSLTPAEKHAKDQEAYKDIYRKGDASDIISVGQRGAGLGIDALWSLLSREGKNARYLQKILERDYRDQIISYRYKVSIVSEATGLTGDSLRDFMEQYRPSYNFVLQANDYELIEFIKSSYDRYKRNPAASRLPSLKP